MKSFQNLKINVHLLEQAWEDNESHFEDLHEVIRGVGQEDLKIYLSVKIRKTKR